MPLIGWDFASAPEINAVQAQAVDLGDCCAITPSTRAWMTIVRIPE